MVDRRSALAADNDLAVAGGTVVHIAVAENTDRIDPKRQKG